MTVVAKHNVCKHYLDKVHFRKYYQISLYFCVYRTASMLSQIALTAFRKVTLLTNLPTHSPWS